MITISLCMIVRNEEEVLDRCLSSVQGVVDEYIIVDTGSTDRTKEIALKYTDKVYDFEWINDFAAARNYSFSKATQEYILWLDADDTLDEANKEKLRQLKHTLNPSFDGVRMHYNLAFDDSGNPTFSLMRDRLVRRDRNFKWEGPVHEIIAMSGNVFESDIAIEHHKDKPYTDRNLQIYLEREKQGEQFTPRDLYYFGNELRDNGSYDRAIEYYTRFLNTGQGWIEDNIQACLKMEFCYVKKGMHKEAIAAACQSLWYGPPRPEFCCDLGDIYLELGQYNSGIYWYKQALQLDSVGGPGLTNKIVTTWYPHLQICLCYDKICEYELASEHNEKALAFSPQHPSMLYNRSYFIQKLGAQFVRGEGTPDLAPEVKTSEESKQE